MTMVLQGCVQRAFSNIATKTGFNEFQKRPDRAAFCLCMQARVSGCVKFVQHLALAEMFGCQSSKLQ